MQLLAVNLSYGVYALDAGESIRLPWMLGSIHQHLLAPGAP